MSHSDLENIKDENWRSFITSSISVLLVSETSCPHCKKWKEELARYLDEEGPLDGVRFGNLVLDGEGVAEIKKANEWIDVIEGLPFNAIYVNGEPKTSFYGGGVNKLKNRLKRLKNEP